MKLFRKGIDVLSDNLPIRRVEEKNKGLDFTMPFAPKERKGTTVRITDQAYSLLSEKAEKYNVSMKELASEAIVLLISKKDKYKEQTVTFERLNERAIKLQKTLLVHVIANVAIGTILGIIIGVML